MIVVVVLLSKMVSQKIPVSSLHDGDEDDDDDDTAAVAVVDAVGVSDRIAWYTSIRKGRSMP